MEELTKEHYVEKLVNIINESRPFYSWLDKLEPMPAEDIAYKSIYRLVSLFTGDKKITSFAASIGEAILENNEDLSLPEGKISHNRIAYGKFGLRCMERAGFVYHYPNLDDSAESLIKKDIDFIHKYDQEFDEKKAKGTYYVTPVQKTKVEIRRVKRDGKIKEYKKRNKYSPILDSLFKDLEPDYLPVCKRPSFDPPEFRTTFFDAVQGDLVSGVPNSRAEDFSYENMPMVYNAVNMLQQQCYEINPGVAELVNHFRSHKILTFKDMVSEKRYGKLREINFIIDTMNWIGDQPFYLYWYLAFNGRAFCRTEYFNPQGNKMVKGILQSPKGVRLGDSVEVNGIVRNGWDALMMHTANCFGEDKLTIDERIEWTYDNMDKILECANNPKENLWWMKADAPWEFVAAILEIKAATDSESEYEYITKLPIGIDASNSAFQMIALALKSKTLGAQCNLVPSDTISDSYIIGAESSWEKLAELALAEIDAGVTLCSKYWLSITSTKKRRKAVKRSIMTYPYCCGKATMGEHIFNDLIDEPGFEKIMPEDANLLGKVVYAICVEKYPEITAYMEIIQYVATLQARKGEDFKVSGIVTKFPYENNYRIHRRKITKFGDIRLKYIYERGIVVSGNAVRIKTPAVCTHSLDKEVPLMLANMMDGFYYAVHDCFFALGANVWHLYNKSRECYKILGNSEIMEHILRQNNCLHLMDDDGVIHYKNKGEDCEFKLGDLNFNVMHKNQWMVC